MSENLSKSAKTVQEALDAKGISTKVLELAASTRTALDAATSIGCEVAQICKSLIFKTQDTSHPVLVLASGPTRVNEKRIAEYLGEVLVKADADFAREITGFAIGGIPPIGHLQKIERVFIDEDLLKFEELWAAAGTPNSVFCLKGKDLVEMTDGRVVDIK